METELVVAQTMIGLDRGTAQKHANELFRLGEIRARLDENGEAERLYDQAAGAFWELRSPINREWSAFARMRQASMCAADDRFTDALAIIERLVEQFKGFPKFVELADARVPSLGIWLDLLQHHGDYERLYTATGVALDRLSPDGPPKERLEIARTLAKRARAARALGQTDEAAELFEQAIARFKAEDPALAGRELIETTANLTEMQAELGLVKESLTAFGQMAGTTATTAPKLALSRVFGPRRKQQ